MESFFSHIGRSSLIKAVLGIALLHAPILGIEEGDSVAISSKDIKKLNPPDIEEIHNTPSLKNLGKKKDTYTINFSNVSIIEYIRFTSKITNLNFFYNDDDLQFNVSIVSEEAVTPSNVVSILIQVLRIHGLIVLEQDNTLLITKVRSVSQLATVISSDLPETSSRSPLVTRVFRIKNANLNTVATVVRPMLSDSALLEVSLETKQLIITDITTNVDKISTLLATLDAPHSSLEIDSYITTSGDLDTLIRLATQIITPFTEGNPLIFVPHVDTGTVFIISTPYLIERALAVLEDLDNPTSPKGTVQGQTIFLYQLQYKSPDDFMAAAQDLSRQLKKQDGSPKLIECLNNAKIIKESNSILFVADDTTLTKIKQLLPTLDTSSLGMPNKFYVYKIQQASEEQLQNSVDTLAEDLQKAPQPDNDLIDALTSVKYIPNAHALIFIGTNASLAKIADIVPTLDVVSLQAQQIQQSLPSQFLVYHPKYTSGKTLEKAIQDVAKNLKDAGLADPSFLKAVEAAKWAPLTNTLLFTGNPETLARIQNLLESFDSGTETFTEGTKNFYLYKLQHVPGSAVIDNLKKIYTNLESSDIPNQALIATLQNVKWIKENNSLLLTGTARSIEQARTVIEQFDIVPLASLETNKSAFFIYKPEHQKPDVLQSNLRDMSQDLEGSGLVDPDLLLTLNTMRYVESTRSIIFTGSPASLEKVKEILARIDTISPHEVQIQQLGESTFFIYKVQYIPAAQLIAALKGVVSDLQRNGGMHPEVAQTINTLRWIKETNSILFTGSATALQEVEAMVKKIDNPAFSPRGEGTQAASTFIVYTPRYQPGDELIKILEDFAQSLIASGIANKSLFDTIANLKWVPRTCSLLISGDPDSIAKVDELLRRFDVPTAESTKNTSSIESIQNTSFLIYKLQYHQGNEILSALKQIATDLGPGAAIGNQNLLSAINSLQWIRVTNSLLASGEADTLSKLRDLVQNLDVPLRQVFIEVLVIETNLINTQNFGLQWGGKMQFLNKFAAGTGNFPPATVNLPNNALAGSLIPGIQTGINAVNATTFPSAANIPFISGFDLGVIGDIIMHKGRSFISLGSLVNALQTDADSTIVMNPKIITQDNRTSTIFVGNNIPFIGSIVTTSAQIVSASSNIEYRDIGFNLTITPTIGNSNVVTLDISNDISAVTNTPTIGVTSASNQTSNIQGIQTSHTSMTTRVHVPDQHFVVLSGMIQDTKARFRSGFPCLGGLPVIGALFSENDRIDNKQNIIIFLRPHVVNTYDDLKAITEGQEDLFKEAASLPVLKEEFDAGIDLVKKPGD